MINTIQDAAPLISKALAHRPEQGAVTFSFGSFEVVALPVQRRDGQPIDPMGSSDAIAQLIPVFQEAGWEAFPTRDEDGDYVRVSFVHPQAEAQAWADQDSNRCETCPNCGCPGME